MLIYNCRNKGLPHANIQKNFKRTFSDTEFFPFSFKFRLYLVQLPVTMVIRGGEQ